jgi:hypothetical protein
MKPSESRSTQFDERSARDRQEYQLALAADVLAHSSGVASKAHPLGRNGRWAATCSFHLKRDASFTGSYAGIGHADQRIVIHPDGSFHLVMTIDFDGTACGELVSQTRPLLPAPSSRAPEKPASPELQQGPQRRFRRLSAAALPVGIVWPRTSTAGSIREERLADPVAARVAHDDLVFDQDLGRLPHGGVDRKAAFPPVLVADVLDDVGDLRLPLKDRAMSGRRRACRPTSPWRGSPP